MLAIETDRSTDRDELRHLMIAAPQMIFDEETDTDNALGVRLRYLLTHALDHEYPCAADRFTQHHHLAGQRHVDERLSLEERAPEIDRPLTAARVGLEHARADHESVRQEAEPRERQELRDREVGERGDRALRLR